MVQTARYTSRLAVLAGVLLLAAGPASAQDADYPLTPREAAPGEGPLLMGRHYPEYHIIKPPPVLRVHDIVTIRVDEASRMVDEGELERRKTALYDAILNDWVSLDGLKAIRPNEQSDGDPRVQGNLSRLFRAEAELETAKRLTFEIAAKVVEIRPNGNLVLEAHKSFRVNDVTWEYSLSGICRKEDIQPNNTLLSNNIYNLRVYKREGGDVRDGYKLGWFSQWFDWVNPF